MATVGSLTFPIVQKYVDDIVTVTEEEIANAILLLLEQEKTLVEGAGSVGFATLCNRKIQGVAGKNVAVSAPFHKPISAKCKSPLPTKLKGTSTCKRFLRRWPRRGFI